MSLPICAICRFEVDPAEPHYKNRVKKLPEHDVETYWFHVRCFENSTDWEIPA